METATLETVAREAYDALEWRKRDDGSEYVARKDDAPEWVEGLCYAAHGDMLPDDWRYQCIRAALGHIADGADEDDGGPEFADSYVDVYTGSRLEWLASHLSRPGYCDEAQDEGLAGENADVVTLAGLGQYMEASEVYGLVADALRERLDWIETRLEELREELRAEGISYGELAELQGLAPYIAPGDVELLEAAGVPEFPEEDDAA